MATHLFSSADTGAPVLTHGASTIIGILDACLVNGYNTKTVTLTRSGSTVTASCTAHGYSDTRVINISGADQAEYNGNHRITSVTTNTFTFEIGTTPVSPATGTISCKVASAGWTKPFSGTNKAVYRNDTILGLGAYLRVDDSNASHALVRMYSTMTDVDTGSNVIPDTAYFATGLIWSKSTTSDATARSWYVVADGRTMYFATRNKPPDTYCYESCYTAGEIASEVPGDLWSYTLSGRRDTTSAGAGGVGYGDSFYGIVASPTGTVTPSAYTTFWIGRSYTGSGGAIPINVTSIGSTQTNYVGLNGAMVAPSPGGGHEYYIPAFICQASTLRGFMRGARLPLNAIGGTVSFGTARDGLSGQPAGSKMLTFRHATHSYYTENANCPCVAVETFLDWD